MLVKYGEILVSRTSDWFFEEEKRRRNFWENHEKTTHLLIGGEIIEN